MDNMTMDNKQKTILIIDDDHDFLFQLEAILTSAEYRVIKAESRAEGEKLLAAEKPDGLIVDLMLEENDDGFVLCHLARKLYPGLPIIMVTGVAGEEGIAFDTITGEERDWIKADLILAKPVRAEQVLSALERLKGENR